MTGSTNFNDRSAISSCQIRVRCGTVAKTDYMTDYHLKEMSTTVTRGVLPSKLGGGPHGLGDPDDTSLRKVEVEVMIPKKMREIAKREKCSEEVQKFTQCCKESSLLMVVKCREENDALKSCLTSWYQNEGFKERCKQEYIKQRNDYRRTGISHNQKNTRLPNAM